ncbi:MAG: hypothetical protein JO306_00505 [Gemmatimonadetes bacterium]|nr:hypothetical protein [Gemmatimonadota bacterium]
MMRSKLDLDGPGVEAAPNPGLTDEEKAALKAIGWREGRGQFNPDWKPLPKRPKWLAFIYRTLRLKDA